MFDHFWKGIVDLIYGTNRVRRRFERDNPGVKILAADASKGIATTTDQDLQRGVEWVISQRAVILLTEKQILCGKWTIPLNTVSGARLIEFTSLFGGGYVLKVQTMDGRNYQFGMQRNAEWTRQKRLPLVVEKGLVKHSAFSLITRISVLACLAYWLYEEFFAR
ncbi:MAG TPA: hypothetical protein PL070_13725 [Flavobacteriales bacterium]|nr:hypothetical protein [Flavobacteriales bacterium]